MVNLTPFNQRQNITCGCQILVNFNAFLGDNKKFRKDRSDVWNYFVKRTKESAECQICMLSLGLRGGISNLKRHLTRVHKSDLIFVFD